MSPESTSAKIVPMFIILLLLIITIGGIIIWARYESGDPVEISNQTREIWEGTIYIGGAVDLPGYYPFAYQDTIETLIRAAGGTTDNYTLCKVTFFLNDSKLEQQPQKIDINRAEKWLLEALPGIGETIAQRIIDYRTDNGKFINTMGLLKIEGIGTLVYENIRELITVSD